MSDKHPSTTSGGKHKRILLCVLLAAAAAVAVVAVLLLRQAGTPGSSSQEEAASQKVSITINVSGEGFDSSSSTPTPLHIEGDGVSEDAFSDSSGNAEAELDPGDYKVTVAAPCFASDGSLFRDSDSEPASVTLNEGNSNVTVLVSVAAIDPADVTDDDIQQAKDYAEKAGTDSGTVDGYAQKAEQKRQDALDAKAAEDEKQQALDANPSVIHSVPNTQDSEMVTLTGTLCRETRTSPVRSDEQADVYYLELPSQVTVTGTQYADESSTKIILHQQWPSEAEYKYAAYEGMTVSITGQVGIDVHGTNPSYGISLIGFYENATLTKVFS